MDFDFFEEENQPDFKLPTESDFKALLAGTYCPEGNQLYSPIFSEITPEKITILEDAPGILQRNKSC
jgi:hypothetical protein